MLPSTQEPFLIDAQGSGTVTRLAERAKVRITVSATGEDQEKIAEEVRATSSKLHDQLQDLAPKAADGTPADHAAVTIFSMSGLATNSFTPYDYNKRKKNPKQYTTTRRFQANFRNLDVFNEVASQLAKTKHVEIDSTRWIMTEKTQREMRSEARKRALNDAIDQANDYAEIVGRKVKAKKITASPSSPFGLNYSYGMMNAQAQQAQQQQQQVQRPQGTSSGAGAEGGSGSAVEPEQITVSSSVQVQFVAEDESP